MSGPRPRTECSRSVERLAKLSGMIFFRKSKCSAARLWVIALSMMTVWVQMIGPHVHGDGDNSRHAYDLSSFHEADDHPPLELPHPSIDMSHMDHHSAAVHVIEGCPDCILNPISVLFASMALLVFGSLLSTPGLRQFRFHRHQATPIAGTRWRYHRTPPLRAPPR